MILSGVLSQRCSDRFYDSVWDSCLLACTFDGAVGSTSGYSDLKGHVVSEIGSSSTYYVVREAGQFGSAARFTARSGTENSKALRVAHVSKEFDLTTGSWTIGAWVKGGSGPVCSTIETMSSWVRGWNFLVNTSTGQMTFGGGVNSSGTSQHYRTATNATYVTSGFNYVEVCCDGYYWYFFWNGHLIGKETRLTLTENPNVNCLLIGRSVLQETQWAETASFALDNLMVAKGVCMHTADFTPPTITFPDA